MLRGTEVLWARPCQGPPHVPPSQFLTALTACATIRSWACCIPLPTMGFARFSPALDACPHHRSTSSLARRPSAFVPSLSTCQAGDPLDLLVQQHVALEVFIRAGSCSAARPFDGPCASRRRSGASLTDVHPRPRACPAFRVRGHGARDRSKRSRSVVPSWPEATRSQRRSRSWIPAPRKPLTVTRFESPVPRRYASRVTGWTGAVGCEPHPPPPTAGGTCDAEARTWWRSPSTQLAPVEVRRPSEVTEATSWTAADAAWVRSRNCA